jgi:hypothetical protein
MLIKEKLKISFYILAAFYAINIMACENVSWLIADLPPATPEETAPFVLTKPAVEIYEQTNSFKYAGIVFQFLNQGAKAVDSITVSFMLFDSKTQATPFIGSNKFVIKLFGYVPSNEAKQMAISLDKYIHVAPAEPYIIDFFYISEICYVDNTVWQDKNGKYRVRF